MPVGVLLLIYVTPDNGDGIRCNLSSWYVESTFRSYAPMLTSVAQRHKHVTYINISPARCGASSRIRSGSAIAALPADLDRRREIGEAPPRSGGQG